jgi:hypothetical protein
MTTELTAAGIAAGQELTAELTGLTRPGTHAAPPPL